MLIGYARVSTGIRVFTWQIDAVEEAGCKRDFFRSAGDPISRGVSVFERDS